MTEQINELIPMILNLVFKLENIEKKLEEIDKRLEIQRMFENK